LNSWNLKVNQLFVLSHFLARTGTHFARECQAAELPQGTEQDRGGPIQLVLSLGDLDLGRVFRGDWQSLFHPQKGVKSSWLCC
jgi:hypothetical protein